MAYPSRSCSRSSSSSSLATAREYQSEDSSSSSSEDDSHGPTGTVRRSSKRERLQDLKEKTKLKTKRFLHLGNVDGAHDDVDHEEDDPVFDADMLGEMANPEMHPFGGEQQHKGLGGSLHKVMQTISHPRNAIKSATTKTTAGILSTAEHPLVSQRADQEFLREHCHVAREDDSKDFPDASSETGEYLETARKLEDHRESMRVAWITGAHVDRVRVPRRGYLKFLDSDAFEEVDDEGNLVRFCWEKWIGYMMLYYTQDFTAQYIDDSNELPVDLGRLKSYVERLVMASAPWQAWCMHVRRVFRWEDPVETVRWLVVYSVVWYTQNMMAFIWAYIIYMVVRNRYRPSSLESLQESMNRNLERGSIAYRLGELIDKHGREDWLGPLIDEVGPMIQLQLGDLANLLEVFANFYAWKSPRKTAYSIFLFSTCLIVALAADMKFCMKVFWFVGGSEWSFGYLRQRAQINREEILKRKVEEKAKESKGDKDDVPNGSIGLHEAMHINEHSTITSRAEEMVESISLATIPCTYDHHSGELVILPSGLAFNQTHHHHHIHLSGRSGGNDQKTEIWHRTFLDLTAMRKVKPSNNKQNLLSKKDRLITAKKQQAGIELDFMDETTVAVQMKDTKTRDRVFNLIIGHSGWRWM
ncbi:MAG: hypothetical protein M1816_007666 [Peltula sp. TS41687]|nr:MAG: hypothetical protein M1816_007666 [Peltula sp. TS41687]